MDWIVLSNTSSPLFFLLVLN